MFVKFFKFTVKSLQSSATNLQLKGQYQKYVYVVGGGGGEKNGGGDGGNKTLRDQSGTCGTTSGGESGENVEYIAVVANVVVEKQWFLSHLQHLDVPLTPSPFPRSNRARGAIQSIRK